MLNFLTWIFNHAGFFCWIVLCMSVGGLLTPRFTPKQSQHSEIDAWIGAFIGLIVAVVTDKLGLLSALSYHSTVTIPIGWIVIAVTVVISVAFVLTGNAAYWQAALLCIGVAILMAVAHLLGGSRYQIKHPTIAFGWVAGLLILLVLLTIHWFGALPQTVDMPRPQNWLIRHTLQRYTFDSILGQVLSHVILLVWSLIVLVPLWTMLVNSLKPQREIFRTPFEWPSAQTRTFQGFRSAWVDGNFDLYFKNSIIVTVTSLMLILVFGALAAYALSNWRSKLSSGIYLYFIAGLMVPIRLGTINIVTIVQDFGLQGKLLALIPIYVAMGLPIAAFVLTAFMRGVPHDLIDAARIDGASEVRVFWQIIIPLTRPALATVATFNMIPIWNDLWFPLILTRNEQSRTVTYGVSLLFGQYQTDWNAILSTLSLAAVPVLILYLLMSKQFIKGLTAGAVKG